MRDTFGRLSQTYKIKVIAGVLVGLEIDWYAAGRKIDGKDINTEVFGSAESKFLFGLEKADETLHLNFHLIIVCHKLPNSRQTLRGLIWNIRYTEVARVTEDEISLSNGCVLYRMQ